MIRESHSLTGDEGGVLKVFLTGGTGYIGSAVAAKFRERGHDVTALARIDSNTNRLRDLGCAIVDGELQTLGTLAAVLRAHDTIIHSAFNPKNAAGDDEAALDAILSLAEHDAYFIYTSGVWVLGATGDEPVDEEKPTNNPLQISAWRVPHEQRVLRANGERFRTCVLRPGCVYGRRQSLLQEWFRAAENDETIRLIGDGENAWAMVHVDDLADLYVRLAEVKLSGVAHGVDDTADPLHECALELLRVADSRSELTTTPLGDAREKLGVFADALAVNQRVSSEKTRTAVGWLPQHSSFTASVAEQWDEWKRSTR